MKTKIHILSILLLFCCSLLLAQNQHIYVSDAGNFNNPPWQILKYDQNGQNPEVFIDQNLAWPQDIVFLPGQAKVIVSNLNTGRITKYVASTGEYVSDFADGIGGPTRMKIGADNLLYVLQWQGDGLVLRYDLSGNLVDQFTDVGVPQSIGLDWDSSGNLYVSSYTGAFVRKFDTDGNDLGIFVDQELVGPTNIWLDDEDNLYVLDWSDGNIKYYDAAGNYLGIFIDGLVQPEGVAFLPDGRILIGNGGPATVNLYEEDGTFIEELVPEGSGGLLQPNAVILQDPTLGVNQPVQEIQLLQQTYGRTFAFTSKAMQVFDQARLLNMSGQLLREIDLKLEPVWSAATLASGIYLLEASGPGGTAVQKVLVGLR